MFIRLIAVASLALGTVFALFLLQGTQTLRELLTENKTLRASLANLSHEEQIGYARVVAQEYRDGRLFTTLRFVQTARDNPLQVLMEREYEIEGDIVHFDALIVRFDPKLVEDGRERALFIWRRVYGEHTPPAEAPPIASFGAEPVRYADVFSRLRLRDRQMFWEHIWDLANDPGQLASLGVSATYGNAVYTRLQPGLIYIFKLTAGGQVYPEVVPDLRA